MWEPTLHLYDQNDNRIIPAIRQLEQPSDSDCHETEIYNGEVYEIHLTNSTTIVPIHISTSGLFRSRLNIRLIAPSQSNCTIAVTGNSRKWTNQQEINEHESLWICNLELTPDALAHRKIEGQLQITCGDRPVPNSRAFVLFPATTSDHDARRNVHRVVDPSFTCTMALGFALSWFSLISGLFILSVYIPTPKNIPAPFDNIPQIVLPIALVILPSILKRTSVISYIRLLVASLYLRKQLGWVMLIAISLAMIGCAALIAYCIAEKFIHKERVRNYINTGNEIHLLQALSHYPWRVDIRYAYERITSDIRHQGVPKLRSYVRKIVDHDMFDVAVERAKKSKCGLCTTGDTSNLIDAVVWLASILPEAEPHDQNERTREAFEILDGNLNVDAKLFRLVMQLYFTEDDQLPSVVSDLRRTLDSHGVNLAKSEVAQVATDHLAGELLRNLLGQKQCGDSDTDEILKLYEQIVNARTSLTDNALVWLRPPDKMMIYHYFMSLSGELDHESEMAYEHLNVCDPSFYFHFKTKIYDRKRKEGFYLPEHWRKGTPLGSTPNGSSWKEFVLNSLSEENWRY